MQKGEEMERFWLLKEDGRSGAYRHSELSLLFLHLLLKTRALPSPPKYTSG